MARSAFIRPLPHLLLLISGGCGLGCQIVWTRQLAGGLGQEVPAVLAVVGAFFGGLALGAGVLASRVVATPHPARWYAGLEITVGLWTAVTAWLVPWINDQAGAWIGLSPTVVRHWLVAFGVPLIALLPATLAMGATLPAMVRLAGSLSSGNGSVGSLYAANTLGAVIGTLIGAVWLIPQFGFRRTLLLLAGTSVFCGVVALGFSRAASKGTVANLTSEVRLNPRFGSDRFRPDVLLLAGTGLLGIGFEVLTVRLMAEVIEDTVLAFAAVLSVYLLGTAFGAAGERWWFPRADGRRRVASLLVVLAAACAIGAGALRLTPDTYSALQRSFPDGVAGVMGADALVAAMVIGLPTLLMGAMFAVLAAMQCEADGRMGRVVAWNTLGAAFAPLVIGATLFPLWGGRGAFAVLVGGYAVLATLAARGAALKHRVAVWVAGGTAACGAQFWGADSRALLEVRAANGERLRVVHSGTFATAAVVESSDRHRTLRVNNRFTMGGTGSANAERRHSHLPLLLHPTPRRALFIGVGTGISYGAMRAHPDLMADGVELSPEVAAVMAEFDAESGRAEWAGRLRFQVADARRFIRASSDQFDVIVADLFHPARDGAGGLYTVEHFAAMRARLSPDGLVCQWLPLYQLDRETFQMILRTFLAVFPEAQAWLLRPNLDTPVVGLVGSLVRRTFGPDWFAQRVANPGLRAALQEVALVNGVHVLGSFLADSRVLTEYAGVGPANTDDRPLVSFLAARRQAEAHSHGTELLFDLIERADGRFSDLSGMGTAAFDAGVRDFRAARDLYLRGLAAEDAGRETASVGLFVASAARSPDFTLGYARALTVAMRLTGSDPNGARRLLEDLTVARPEQPVARRLLDRLEAGTGR